MKITNWNGCIPEEVRQEESGEGGEEFMPVYPFEKVVWPKKVGSPFLVGRGGSVKGVKGPGGIVNVPVASVNGGGDGDNTRKKLRSDGNPSRTQQQQQQQPPQQLPAMTTAMATLQNVHAAQSQNPYQHFQQPYLQQQQQQIVNQPQTQRSTTLGPDRSIITAAGGIAAIGGPSQVEKLPAETGKFSYGHLSPVVLVFSFLLLMTFYIVKLFDRDPTTNEVLWFAAPPMNMSRARGPRYSLEYLTYMATKKRKRREDSADGKEEGTKKDGWRLGEELESSASAGAKRPRVPPTVTEMMREVWKEMKADGFTTI